MASLVIQSQTGQQKRVTPNLLPCQIHHNGKLDVSQRHWQAKRGDDGKEVAHFRGRRLFGQTIKIPEGHKGVMLKVTNDKVDKQTPGWNESTHEADDEEEETEDVFIAEEVAMFDEVTVWNHDSVPDVGDDEYIKGIEEWIGMAAAIHSS